jgi:hypothetical protein
VLAFLSTLINDNVIAKRGSRTMVSYHVLTTVVVSGFCDGSWWDRILSVIHLLVSR